MNVNGHFVYGSEIKSLLAFPGFEKKFNEHALDNYLSFQYVVPPETFYQGIQCLLPAHYLWYRNGEVSIHRYWEPRFHPDESMTEEEAVDKIEKVFENSVDVYKRQRQSCSGLSNMWKWYSLISGWTAIPLILSYRNTAWTELCARRSKSTRHSSFMGKYAWISSR